MENYPDIEANKLNIERISYHKTFKNRQNALVPVKNGPFLIKTMEKSEVGSNIN